MQPSADQGRIAELQRWLSSQRFSEIQRLHSAEDVLEQRFGSMQRDYTVARHAAEALYARLRELFAHGQAITTFGTQSPQEIVALKQTGAAAVCLDRGNQHVSSRKDSVVESDSSSPVLREMTDAAAAVVRALLVADQKQRETRARMSAAQQLDSAETDYTPFILSHVDTRDAGDVRIRQAVKRFVEVGVPAIYLEDHGRGSEVGRVLALLDEHIEQLVAARLQFDVMAVPGLVVARTYLGAAMFLDGSNDERDQPFILGTTNIGVPTFECASLAVLLRFGRTNTDKLSGHQGDAWAEAERAATNAWLETSGVAAELDRVARSVRDAGASEDTVFERAFEQFVFAWRREAGAKTFGDAVSALMSWPIEDSHDLPMTPAQWRTFSNTASLDEMRERAESMGIQPIWDSAHAKSADGHCQVKGSVEHAIARSLAAAPHADMLWLEASTPDFREAQCFADAIHAVYPTKMLAYHVSASFDWTSASLDADELRRFPERLAALGYVLQDHHSTQDCSRSPVEGIISDTPQAARRPTF